MTQLTAHLAAALASLDSTNDNHWTNDGQARVDVVNASLSGMDAESVTRQDIIDGAPLFTRETHPQFVTEYQAAIPAALDPVKSQERPPAPPAPPAQASAPAPAASPAAPAASSPPASDHSLPPLGTPQGAPTAATLATIALDPATGPDPVLGEMEGSALDVPLAQLMRSVPMLDAAVAEINERTQAIIHERERLNAELKELYQKSELCVRQLQRIRPKDDPNDGVKAYLAASQRAREERGRRAQAFIKAGTTAKDVAAQLRPGSPIDAAMGQRKAAPGTTRPGLRIPAGV